MLNFLNDSSFRLSIFILVMVLVGACTKEKNIEKTIIMGDNPEFKKAIAVVYPTQGNSASGVITFTQTPDGIHVQGEISGLTPGDHGFHIHQFGDLSKSDGTTAGGHFNPMEMDHSGPDSNMRHVGDLGNITADKNGLARYDRIDSKLTFYGKSSIIGRGLIIHASADDLTSQPTGAAGARVGMAVIGIAKD